MTIETKFSGDPISVDLWGILKFGVELEGPDRAKAATL
jgi:hypothetical protein